MTLHAKEFAKLRRIIALADKLIAESPKPKRGRRAAKGGNGSVAKRKNGKRIRRTGTDLIQFRKMLKSKLKGGISVADLAREQGISSAYIYQL